VELIVICLVPLTIHYSPFTAEERIEVRLDKASALF